ncbi:MAG: hypothetical protein MMC33_006468 [Icmadophila ericetorum]|nr:hypothetical protein [Icmadophila ericetorum]
MGRWSQYEEDGYRLPHGMTRAGYDADTQTYTYRDADGTVYEGEEGNRYGRVNKGRILVFTPDITIKEFPGRITTNGRHLIFTPNNKNN